MLRRFLAVSLAASLGLASPSVLAQQPKGAPATNATDVVLLRNGGMLRGAIAEFVPNDHVVIVTITGETKRIPMSDVQYAGPADRMPSRGGPQPPPGPQPLVSVEGRPAPLQLTADQPGVTFQLKVGEDTGVGVGMGGVYVMQGQRFQRICTAPCNATMPAGTYSMALSKGNGAPVAVDDLVPIQGPATLQGKYTSYLGVRILGYVVMIGSLVSGIYLLVTSFHSEDCAPNDPNCSGSSIDTTRAMVGGAIFVGGGIIGSLLAGKKDAADIVVLPGAVGSIAPKRVGWLSEQNVLPNVPPAPGLNFAVRF